MCSRPHETFSCATVLTAQVLSGLPAIWKLWPKSSRNAVTGPFQAQRIAPKAREPYNSPP